MFNIHNQFNKNIMQIWKTMMYFCVYVNNVTKKKQLAFNHAGDLNQ